MKLKINLKDPYWWFWAVSLVLIVAALAGWNPGYYALIAVSLLQVLVCWVQEKSPVAFSTQVRWVYLAMTLTGLWPLVRLPFYLFLLLGTFMVVFFDRCAIVMMLNRMPWNRGRAPGATCAINQNMGGIR